MEKRDILNYFFGLGNFAKDTTSQGTLFIDPFRKVEVLVSDSTLHVGYTDGKKHCYPFTSISSITCDVATQTLTITVAQEF